MATNEAFRELSQLPELPEISVNFSIFTLKSVSVLLRMVISLDFEHYS